jgi:hypothetical protein
MIFILGLNNNILPVRLAEITGAESLDALFGVAASY